MIKKNWIFTFSFRITCFQLLLNLNTIKSTMNMIRNIVGWMLYSTMKYVRPQAHSMQKSTFSRFHECNWGAGKKSLLTFRMNKKELKLSISNLCRRTNHPPIYNDQFQDLQSQFSRNWFKTTVWLHYRYRNNYIYTFKDFVVWNGKCQMSPHVSFNNQLLFKNRNIGSDFVPHIFAHILYCVLAFRISNLIRFNKFRFTTIDTWPIWTAESISISKYPLDRISMSFQYFIVYNLASIRPCFWFALNKKRNEKNWSEICRCNGEIKQQKKKKKSILNVWKKCLNFTPFPSPFHVSKIFCVKFKLLSVMKEINKQKYNNNYKLAK